MYYNVPTSKVWGDDTGRAGGGPRMEHDPVVVEMRVGHVGQREGDAVLLPVAGGEANERK